MARKPRIDYPGAVHHVMNRGADRQIIFRNDADRELFLTLWAQAVARFGIVVLSFCLMDNHFHVVVVSPEGQLSRTLQFIGRSYTQQFNYHHGRDGALLRGRFHSVLVDSDNYLQRLIRYVELNPVSAGLCTTSTLVHFRWSSFRFHAGRAPTPLWLSTDRVLREFASREQFECFVRSESPDTELEFFYRTEIAPGLVLGDQTFVDAVRPKLDKPTALTAGLGLISMDQVDAAVIAMSPCERDTLYVSTPGKRNRYRSAAVDIAHLTTGATLAELATRYGFNSIKSVHSLIRTSRHSSEPTQLALRTATLRALGRDIAGQRTSQM